ncbi:ABCGC [Hepatospora eriocheir]|uniref:ABCGC n=1 Tax=Hepatospora eriocheir TaxID=1081669 RepID=A0A1X0Q835_9MICR|nr:ABCGC [Hepatospora eriocheir]
MIQAKDQEVEKRTKINYLVNIRSDDDIIICEDVYGVAYTGEILGIIGPSGSGKSSLFDYLSMQYSKTKISEGTIWINNEKVGIKYFNQYLSYKSQFTHSLKKLTVIEHLKFQLYMEGIEVTINKLKYINNVLFTYGMLNKKYTLLDTLSTGELERVNTISSILLNSQIQIYDEPLSNLDVCTAHRMLEDLKNSARNNNKCIILTIHQPNPEILSYIDRLIVMCKHGVVYQGETKNFSKYFSNHFNISIKTAEDLIELCYILDENESFMNQVISECKKNYLMESEAQNEVKYIPFKENPKKSFFKFRISYYIFKNLWRVLLSSLGFFKITFLIIQLLVFLLGITSYIICCFSTTKTGKLYYLSTSICLMYYYIIKQCLFYSVTYERVIDSPIFDFLPDTIYSKLLKEKKQMIILIVRFIK